MLSCNLLGKSEPPFWNNVPLLAATGLMPHQSRLVWPSLLSPFLVFDQICGFLFAVFSFRYWPIISLGSGWRCFPGGLLWTPCLCAPSLLYSSAWPPPLVTLGDEPWSQTVDSVPHGQTWAHLSGVHHFRFHDLSSPGHRNCRETRSP